MSNHFEQLKNELSAIKILSASGGMNGFFGQEALRFRSVSGTLLKNFTTDKNASVDERYLTHILARSLMENYFWLLYIYDDPVKRQIAIRS